MTTRTRLIIAALLAGIAGPLLAQSSPPLDPAAWGEDHVGQPLPQFTAGDECLFCHRDIGPAWTKDRHGQTIREADRAGPALSALANVPRLKHLAGEVELLLGGSQRQRFLKRSAEYGRLDLLSVQWQPPRGGKAGQLTASSQPRWNSQAFGKDCAGCHATGVDSAKQTFAAASLDCYVCHGDVPQKHTTQASLVLLSPHRRDSAAVVTSICAQCHLRTGKSRSSGLPYANNFVAGDNLLRDFQVDLSDEAIARLNPADRHVQQNVQDVVRSGRQDVTCLSCHDVHKSSSRKHQDLADSRICRTCHQPGAARTLIPYEVHSKTCGY